MQAQLAALLLPLGSEVHDITLAKLGAGLKCVHLQSLISHAVQNRQALTLKFLTQRKKDLIEAESGGLLEFIQIRFDLSLVACMSSPRRNCRTPLLPFTQERPTCCRWAKSFGGPVGTGKTFLTTCFAGEVGIPAVTLKNFRSMWQGVTEGTWNGCSTS